jgi:hypothetical protein
MAESKNERKRQMKKQRREEKGNEDKKKRMNSIGLKSYISGFTFVLCSFINLFNKALSAAHCVL